jgi:hypothetical protein
MDEKTKTSSKKKRLFNIWIQKKMRDSIEIAIRSKINRKK